MPEVPRPWHIEPTPGVGSATASGTPDGQLHALAYSYQGSWGRWVWAAGVHSVPAEDVASVRAHATVRGSYDVAVHAFFGYASAECIISLVAWVGNSEVRTRIPLPPRAVAAAFGWIDERDIPINLTLSTPGLQNPNRGAPTQFGIGVLIESWAGSGGYTQGAFAEMDVTVDSMALEYLWDV